MLLGVPGAVLPGVAVPAKGFIGDTVPGGAGVFEGAGEVGIPEGAGKVGIPEGAGVVGIPEGAGVVGVPEEAGVLGIAETVSAGSAFLTQPNARAIGSLDKNKT